MLQRLMLRLRSSVTRSAALLRQAREARETGDFERARECCAALLKSSASNVDAFCLLADIAADTRQVDDGVRWGRMALDASPACASAHYSMGRVWDVAGEFEQAIASYREATRLDPRNAKAHNNLGCALRQLGRHEDALASFEEALRLDPQQPEANQNYAAMSNSGTARELAIQGYRRQLEADPADARALTNLANIYMGAGRMEEARAALDRALAADPNRPDARYSRGLMLLISGNYEEGWKEYQWRWRINNELAAAAHRFPTPPWDGRDVGDGAILLHGEHAFGESMQFVRFARLVAERCGSVIFECASQLKPLLEQVEGVGRVVAFGEPLPPFSAHAPLFCLPALFGTTLSTIPWKGPYIRAQPAIARRWDERLAKDGGKPFRVGIAWTGNPQNPNNLDRSIPAAKLAPLQEIPGVQLHSLQIGVAPAELSAAGLTELIDPTAGIGSFSDTAGLLSLLDLVISIDTSVAHLAGAMGLRTWVLLNHVPDWRYHLDRTDNPWYPSMRLYRQQAEGEWDEVLERVATDLRALALGEAQDPALHS